MKKRDHYFAMFNLRFKLVNKIVDSNLHFCLPKEYFRLEHNPDGDDVQASILKGIIEQCLTD